MKGRAWITADGFQVVRMAADMMKPMPEIKLRDEHQIIEYGPVFFEKSNTEMWLPASVDLDFDFRDHKYHRIHTFSSHLLYSVSACEKVGTPQQTSKKSKELAAN